MIKKRFREDYQGEFIIVETNLTDGATVQKREWIDNPIINQHISHRAAVIGSRIDEKKFPWKILHRHRGGLLSTKKLQTYGSGDLWKLMPFDFFVTKDKTNITEMIDQKYTESTAVYTIPSLCMQYPGHFYIIPYLPYLDVLALPLYLAAFDMHKEIFCIGYNQDIEAGTKTWIEDVDLVFQTFDSTKFYICTYGNIPSCWLEHPNVEHMSYRKFCTYCDV